ncbi:hypothetical protein K5M36_16600 [Chromobacterium vaccinii]|nr:hypothetical protein [Chromobacterium vaccinii]
MAESDKGRDAVGWGGMGWLNLIDCVSPVLILASLVMISLFGYFVIRWVGAENDFFDRISRAGAPDCGKDAYWFAVLQENASFFKRSLGILGGLAVMFCGVATSFAVARGHNEVIKNATSEKLQNIIKVEGGGVGASLVTASPGLVALVCGAFVICFVIASKDSIGSYVSGSSMVKDGKVYCLMEIPNDGDHGGAN